MTFAEICGLEPDDLSARVKRSARRTLHRLVKNEVLITTVAVGRGYDIHPAVCSFWEAMQARPNCANWRGERLPFFIAQFIARCTEAPGGGWSQVGPAAGHDRQIV